MRVAFHCFFFFNVTPCAHARYFFLFAVTPCAHARYFFLVTVTPCAHALYARLFVCTPRQVAVRYGGPALLLGRAYRWTVQTVSKNCTSDPSGEAVFITGAGVLSRRVTSF